MEVLSPVIAKAKHSQNIQVSQVSKKSKYIDFL